MRSAERARRASGGNAVWNEAARHHDEKSRVALVAWIALTNFFNRVNVTTGQLAAGEQWG
ncbi:MAG: hypothetical protein ACREUK_07675 [Burkholderiales bacterium]